MRCLERRAGWRRDLPHRFALPHPDHRRPERRVLSFVGSCLLKVSKDALHSLLRCDAQLNRSGQKTAAQGLVMRDERLKRRHWKIDVSAVRRANAGVDKIDRKLESELHVLTRPRARFKDDAQKLRAGFEPWVEIDRADI